MQFSEISGFDEEKKILVNSVKKNHVAHAQLFFGMEGSPNLTLVLAFISYLNCKNRMEKDSCGHCSSCAKINKMIHPDIHYIFPVAPTTKINKNKAINLFFMYISFKQIIYYRINIVF